MPTGSEPWPVVAAGRANVLMHQDIGYLVSSLSEIAPVRPAQNYLDGKYIILPLKTRRYLRNT